MNAIKGCPSNILLVERLWDQMTAGVILEYGSETSRPVKIRAWEKHLETYHCIDS